MKPPAPGPVSGDSAANDISTAATAASTALPPSRRTAAPASALAGCPAATTPFMGSILRSWGTHSGLRVTERGPGPRGHRRVHEAAPAAHVLEARRPDEGDEAGDFGRHQVNGDTSGWKVAVAA